MRSHLRTNARLLSLFGVPATVIAVIGVYGVVAFAVGRCSREIGIRIALGALPGHVRRHVLLDSAVPILVGSVIGLLTGACLVRFLARMLYGVDPRDPLTFGLLAAAIAGFAVLASWVPARRAVRIDPLRVRRE